MKIPKKLNILGMDYKIKLTKNIVKEKIVEKKDRVPNLAGYCSVRDGIILINCSVSKETQKSVLIHEIIEAIDGHLALHLKHDNIDRLETALYQVFTVNKLLK